VTGVKIVFGGALRIGRAGISGSGRHRKDWYAVDAIVAIYLSRPSQD
jgi:hypothetical protein